MANNANMTPSFGLFGKSKHMVVNNWKVFGLIYLPSLLFALSSNFTSTSEKVVNIGPYKLSISSISGSTSLVGIIILAVLLYIILEVLIQIFLQLLTYHTANGGAPSISALWQDVKKYGWRLVNLWLTVGVYIIGGLLLFIVPGIIMSRKYFLSGYYLIDRDLTTKEAMKLSAEQSSKYSGSIWGILGVGIVLSLSGIVPFVGGLLSAILAALYSVAPALRYFEIKKAES